MAFTLKKTHEYSWPITVEIPSDGGRFVKQTFDCTFKALGQDELSAILSPETPTSGVQTDTALLVEVITGWKGVQDEGGAELPFSETARGELIAIPYVRKALVNGYLDSLAGSKRKN